MKQAIGIVKLIFKSGYVHEFECEMNMEDGLTDEELQDNMIKITRIFIGEHDGQDVDKTWGAMNMRSAYAVNCKEVAFANVRMK
jgi:hypothetical protein